jgi:hypothetical protein
MPNSLGIVHIQGLTETSPMIMASEKCVAVVEKGAYASQSTHDKEYIVQLFAHISIVNGRRTRF